MAAPRTQTPAQIITERQSGGISAGEHLIHDAIMSAGGSPAWGVVDSGIAASATPKYHAQVLALPAAVLTAVPGGAQNWSGGEVVVANHTGVDVQLELGRENTPNVADATYGEPIVPAGAEITLAIPGVRTSIVSATPLAAPTGASPRIVINYVNAFQPV